MKTITNKFKLALAAIGLLAIGTVNAQTTTGDITKQADATLNSSNTAVKLVDNKGTIKYLQAVNGLTSFTNTTPSGGVVTTWQLGGVLTDNTYITADAAKEFALDGLQLVTDVTTASTNAVDREAHGNVGTGFTVLIRDEASGAVQKMQLSDLLKVDGIRVDYTQAANATADVDITVTGLPTLTALTTAAKLFVYRNGVKLRFGTDFSVTADTVTITYSATDLPMYAGDIVEIQYIK
ncbi:MULTISPECIES: hypothetical protein [unclassified Tenacibaculum]|uniref:hypothetical protein n=1 Tax=unclassified Tenacibaculum TaxID=2635139 RepID=UPI001F48E8F4|nr:MULTISPECIES: hypothetical protein [unclassified Tenacibaculum]MCF2873217.1 hypothetical protein [Tenacibaculum sp. Cn5-1]MCF2933373.1 hypothetical protein [Tenacibaculum sp. Cn5-34]MCG7510046.1 hypothetical protein [Tenacibaculum sp. Cn5-46]